MSLLLQFDVVSLPHHKTQPDVLEIVAYQQDKRREWEQTVIWQSLLHDSPVNLIGLDEASLLGCMHIGDSVLELVFYCIGFY